MDKKVKFDITIAVIIVALILYLFLGHNRRQKLLNSDDVHYSVGTITSLEKGAKVAPWFEFEFYDGEKIVKGHYSLAKKPDLSTKSRLVLEKYIGKKFITKFATENSNFNQLDFDSEVPDSINIGDKKIWKKKPYLH